MEGLKELARSTFESAQRFRSLGCDHQFNVIEIGAYPDGEMSFNEWLVYEEDLGSFMTKNPVDEQDTKRADTSLKLVCIDRDMDVTLNVSRAAFTELITAMNADPCVLYMICRDYDGYHEYNGADSPVTAFVGTPNYALVWVFDRRRMTTRGLFLRRRRDPWPDLRYVLWTYRRYIFTPHLLSFASCLHMLRSYDQQTNEFELQHIRHIESPTGFGQYEPPNAVSSAAVPAEQRRFDFDQLTRWSQVAGEVQGNLANKLRHLKTARETLELIQLEYQTKGVDVVASEFLDRYHRSMEALNEAIPAIERQMRAYEEYLVYLKDRAKRLSTVLLALLTHEDAEIHTQLAAASKHDSSSIKTIVVMTMAFLPAAFFAALFAVPSLQGDQLVIVRSNFWVYWAVTLPVTAVVFLVWLVVTQRQWLVDGWKRRRRRTEDKAPDSLETGP